MGGADMKNVVIVSFNTRGGLHHYITQLSNALAEKTEVDLVLPRGSELAHISPRVKAREMDLGNSKWNFVASTVQFWKVIEVATFIRDRRPSVVHFNGVYPWMSFLLPLIRDIPTVMTVHDITPHPGSSKTDVQAVRNMLLSYADRVIVHGDYARDNIRGVSKDIVRIVPHGNYSFFDGGCSIDATGTDTFLFFGRISKYKGVEYLVQAVNELNAEGRDVRLIIAGEGDLTPYRELIEGRPWFEVHNRYVPDEEVTEFFARSFAVVLPYIEVTQSGVVQVALAFKKPVISTRVGCLPEIIKDGVNGRLVNPGDVAALKQAMAQLADDKAEAACMGLRGHQLAGTEYSWDRIADLTIQVYEESIQRKP
jgi:glycosyltransferase involved in cell wall biosynthesis